MEPYRCDRAQIGAGDHLTVRQRSLVMLLAPNPVLAWLTNRALPGPSRRCPGRSDVRKMFKRVCTEAGIGTAGPVITTGAEIMDQLFAEN